MKPQDFKTMLYRKIDEHCGEKEKEILLSMFSAMEDETIDRSCLPQLYQSLYSLYVNSSYDYQSFFLNVRRQKDMHSYYIQCNKKQIAIYEEKTALIKETYRKIYDFIISIANQDKVSDEFVLFKSEAYAAELALDLTKKVYGALLRQHTAKENVDFYNEMSKFKEMLERKEKPFAVKFFYNDNTLTQKFTSPKFLALLNEDFLSFFSLRIHNDVLKQYEADKEIASNLDTVLLYKIACVLFKYNLLKPGLTYNLGDGITFVLTRNIAYFMADLLKKLLGGSLQGRVGNDVDSGDDKNSFVRKRLLKRKPNYDESLDVEPPSFYVMEDDYSAIIMTSDF